MLTPQKPKEAIDLVAHISKTNTPRSHVSEDLRHAIVKTQISETASPEHVVIAADTLLTGIHVQPEENLVTPAGKLDILLMFAEQTLLRKMEKWLLYELAIHLETNTSTRTQLTTSKARSHRCATYK